MGIPWTQKFDGKKYGYKYADWSGQMKALLSAKDFQKNKKLTLYSLQLKGMLSRKSSRLKKRNAAENIFDFLHRLYVGIAPVADFQWRNF